MANQVTINSDQSGTISIHGRDSFVHPFELYDVVDGVEVQIDISTRPIRFEVDGVPINTLLAPNPDDPKGKLIVLTNAQVATLKTTQTSFVVRDETRLAEGLADVLWSGKISRYGYVGDPDQVDG